MGDGEKKTYNSYLPGIGEIVPKENVFIKRNDGTLTAVSPEEAERMIRNHEGKIFQIPPLSDFYGEE